MGVCSAAVSSDFDPDGTMSFTVDVDDCVDNEGRFEIEVLIDQGDGRTQRLEKRLEWSRTHDSTSATVDYRVHLSPEESLLSVEVKASTIDCKCHSD